MTDEVKVLSDDEVNELNYLESKSRDTSLDSVEIDKMLRLVPALCATVRALRGELDARTRLHSEDEVLLAQRWDRIQTLEAENTALREQLAHWQERTRTRTVEVEQLQAQLAQVEEARNQLSTALSVRDAQLAQVTQERDALRNSASIVAFQAHQIDGQIATSLMDNARKQCVKRVREYLTDCRDEETGIIEAVALDLESLIPQLEQP